MIWENDGSASDAINIFAEEVGDGAVMDAFRRKMAFEWEGKFGQLLADFDSTAARVNECERVAEDETGLMPDFSVPQILYHQYAAEFKMKAIQEGMTLPMNGYECWDCPEFIAWFKKKHPELVFKEAPRNACIIVPAGKYTRVREAAAVA